VSGGSHGDEPVVRNIRLPDTGDRTERGPSGESFLRRIGSWPRWFMAAPGRSPSSPGFQAIASQDSAIARRDGRSGLLNPRSLSAPRAVSVTSGTITTCSAAGRPRGRTAFERGKAVTAALSAPGRSAPASEPACQPGFRRPFEHVKGNRAPGRSTGAASWGELQRPASGVERIRRVTARRRVPLCAACRDVDCLRRPVPARDGWRRARLASTPRFLLGGAGRGRVSVGRAAGRRGY
jgi:hypothetical protein